MVTVGVVTVDVVTVDVVTVDVVTVDVVTVDVVTVDVVTVGVVTVDGSFISAQTHTLNIMQVPALPVLTPPHHTTTPGYAGCACQHRPQPPAACAGKLLTHHERAQHVHGRRVQHVRLAVGVVALQGHHRDGHQHHAKGQAVEGPHKEDGHLGAGICVVRALPSGQGQQADEEEDHVAGPVAVAPAHRQVELVDDCEPVAPVAGYLLQGGDHAPAAGWSGQ